MAGERSLVIGRILLVWTSRDETPPPIVVGEVNEGRPPFRRVQIKGVMVGKAHDAGDVIEFARRAGLPDLDLDDPDLVIWRGGGKDEWEP